MSDEVVVTKEIPAEDEAAGADLTAIDRTGNDPRVVALAPGAALSVLWWIEGDEIAR